MDCFNFTLLELIVISELKRFSEYQASDAWIFLPETHYIWQVGFFENFRIKGHLSMMFKVILNPVINELWARTIINKKTGLITSITGYEVE